MNWRTWLSPSIVSCFRFRHPDPRALDQNQFWISESFQLTYSRLLSNEMARAKGAAAAAKPKSPKSPKKAKARVSKKGGKKGGKKGVSSFCF